jgi:hypothetical protein
MYLYLYAMAGASPSLFFSPWQTTRVTRRPPPSSERMAVCNTRREGMRKRTKKGVARATRCHHPDETRRTRAQRLPRSAPLSPIFSTTHGGDRSKMLHRRQAHALHIPTVLMMAEKRRSLKGPPAVVSKKEGGALLSSAFLSKPCIHHSATTTAGNARGMCECLCCVNRSRDSIRDWKRERGREGGRGGREWSGLLRLHFA